MKYKLVAFDLDGTFLDSEKHLIEENVQALQRACKKGLYVVPATGRTWPGIPEELRALPFIRYCITVNGAQIYDRQQDRILHREEIPAKRALELMEFMDGVDALYDCYQDNAGWMSRRFYEKLEEYVTDPVLLPHVRRLRQPVEELKDMIRQNGRSVQKMQMHFKDMDLRLKYLDLLPGLLPDMAVTSSLYNNIEINCSEANKGAALERLCGILGVEREESIAFGDDTNDMSMLRAAGVGVAMGNAKDIVKAAADMVTLTNDEAGLAKALEKLIY